MAKWGYFNILQGVQGVIIPFIIGSGPTLYGPLNMKNLCLGLQFLAIYVNISEVVCTLKKRAPAVWSLLGYDVNHS